MFANHINVLVEVLNPWNGLLHVKMEATHTRQVESLLLVHKCLELLSLSV